MGFKIVGCGLPACPVGRQITCCFVNICFLASAGNSYRCFLKGIYLAQIETDYGYYDHTKRQKYMVLVGLD